MQKLIIPSVLQTEDKTVQLCEEHSQFSSLTGLLLKLTLFTAHKVDACSKKPVTSDTFSSTVQRWKTKTRRNTMLVKK